MNPLLMSVVVPVHNRHDLLLKLLGDLNRQEDASFEVVVVDDGSTDGLTEALGRVSFKFPLVLKRHEQCRGVGAARNTGVIASHGGIIVFIDSDSGIEGATCLAEHRRIHECGADLPESDGGIVLHSTVCGVHHGYWGNVDGYSNWFCSCFKSRRRIYDHHVPMNNTSVSRRVFDKVGMFDETLKVCEDAEWCFRCLELGVPLLFVPGIPVTHQDRSTFRTMWNHYEMIGRYAHLVRLRRPARPYHQLFARGKVGVSLLFLPLAAAITTYIVVRWFTVSPVVLFYAPGIFVSNVAYCAGMLRQTWRPETV